MDKAVVGEGLTCARRRSVTGFTQLEISDGSEVCRVDLAYDARIRPIEQTPLAATLALEELAADKVLALFSRAQARDFIDVAALAERFGWPRLYELAAEKDPGLTGPGNCRAPFSSTGGGKVTLDLLGRPADLEGWELIVGA